VVTRRGNEGILKLYIHTLTLAALMGAIRLGKILLRWCHRCNLPILEERRCALCGEATEEVHLTPPGDCRPAFPKDIQLLRSVVDEQFGEGCGIILFPEGRIILLNKVPALDRMEEAIIDGQVMGSLRFDPGRGWVFVTRMEAARVLQAHVSKGYVVADDGAVDPVASGKNLMAPGVVARGDGIRFGDEVLILNMERKAIATGIARMEGDEMTLLKKGLAVKSRWTALPSDPPERLKNNDWEEALKANRATIDRAVEEAKGFIRRVMEKEDLPTVVSFSGGKDSLACALLSLDAGFSLPLLFIDTCLEFKETVDFVRDFASRHGLPLIWERAEEKVFEEGLSRFGPPSRDFRWCCKTNKLGPLVRCISHHFPQGVLSFIGQRRYESESRSQKRRVWRNPWVPGQLGASPIQNWTALHVWMYIFMRGESYNPWYGLGLDRIGCFLCPAADLGELDQIRDECDQLVGWESTLRDIAMERGLSETWVEFGLWRWRNVPESMKYHLEKRGIETRYLSDVISTDNEGLELQMEEASTGDGIYRSTGRLGKHLDLRRVCNLLNMVGTPALMNGTCIIEGARITAGGEILVEGESLRDLRERISLLFKPIVKSEECVGCGLCLGLCANRALYLENGKIRIDESRCIHCGRCIEPCPALFFGSAELEF